MRKHLIAILLLGVVPMLALPCLAATQTSAFTYQGELRDSGAPVIGLPDLEFRLYDALSNGNQIGTTFGAPSYPVLDGLLTIELDFGPAAFVGQQRWLEISVDGTPLAPRQKLTATPYATHSLSVADGAITSASVLDGSLNAADIDGSSMQRRVTQSCVVGSSIRAIDALGGVICEGPGASGDITAVTSGAGLSGGATSGDALLEVAAAGIVQSMIANGAVGATQTDASQVQRRVGTACVIGSSIRQIDADGGVQCQVDDVGTGDVTSVSAGTALSGGGLSGALTLGVGNNAITATQLANGAVGGAQIDNSQVQSRIGAGCVIGSSIRQINSDGSVVCQLDGVGTGDITSLSAGAGLVGGGTTADITIGVGADAVNSGMIGPAAVGDSELAPASVGTAKIISTQVQRRVIGTCAATQVLRSINEDGSVVCEATNFGLARTALPIDSAGNIDVEIGADGLPLLAYVDTGSQDAHVVKCGNAKCSSGNIDSTIDAVVGVGGSPTIEIDLFVPPDGIPIVAYFEASQGDLRYVRCGNASCSSSNTATTIQSTGNVGLSARIAMTAAGNPMMAYLATSPKRVLYSVCSSLTCASVTTVTLATTPEVPEAPVLLLSGGVPIVIYYESVAKDLKAIRCSDASCAAPIAATLAATGDVGRYAAAIVIAGQVTIAFREEGANAGLKAVRCSDAVCTSATSPFAVDAEVGSGFSLGAAISASGAPMFAGTSNSSNSVLVASCGAAACNHNNLSVSVDINGPVGTTTRTGIALPADGLPVLAVPRGVTANFLKCGTRTCF